MKYLSVIILLLVILFPDLSFAQEGQFVTCEGRDCSGCNLVQGMSRILAWLIGMMMVIFAVVTVWAGMGLVTSGGNPDAKTKAKERLMNAFIGLLIVLAGWLVVDNIMRVLLKGTGGEIGEYGIWSQIKCTSQRTGQVINPNQPTAPGGPTGNTGGGPTGNTGQVSEGEMTHAEAMAALSGITVTSTAGPGGVRDVCATGTGCTTLNGMQNATVQQIRNIDNACPSCNIVVVGGTEPGHSSGEMSHANGYKVDLDDSPALDNFLRSNLTQTGERGGDYGGTIYKDSCGNEYVRESTHWDIKVVTSCPL